MGNYDITHLQPQLIQRFQQIIAHKTLSHAYLFFGPVGSGEEQFAQWLAMRLLCPHVQKGMPCGQCRVCQQIMAGDHPDVLTLQPQGQMIKVDDIRWLKREASKSGMESQYRIFIIKDADQMNTSAANSLLKVLEEPVNNVLILLITHAKEKILPTIISRVQTVLFKPIAMQSLLTELQKQIPLTKTKILVHLTNDIDSAEKLANDTLFDQQIEQLWRWLQQIANHDDIAFITVQTQLMPLLKDKDQQQRFLALISLALQDILLSYWQNDYEAIFTNQKKIIDKWLHNYSQQQLLNQIDAALLSQREFRFNVGFQNILESLTLKMLMI